MPTAFYLAHFIEKFDIFVISSLWLNLEFIYFIRRFSKIISYWKLLMLDNPTTAFGFAIELCSEIIEIINKLTFYRWYPIH